MTAPLLELQDVTVSYRQDGRWLDAVRQVSLTIDYGQSYGLVGESGSGKSTLALAVMRYLSENGAVRQGSIRWEGRDVWALNEQAMAAIWRNHLKLVPQNPLVSLNPSLRIGDQLAEALTARPDEPVADSIHKLLGQVRIADPGRVAASYPHQLSGGMQQRVMIAMALSSEPKLLVMDEPTTNLDVTTEATILDLVRDLVRLSGTSVLYVSHNLGVVRGLCDRVAVLYAGELVEDAAVSDLYHRPLHPYTQGLLNSVPRLGQNKSGFVLQPIPGNIPRLGVPPIGCIFAPRCPVAIDRCASERPAAEEPAPGRRVRCHRWHEIAAGLPVWEQAAPAHYPPAGRTTTPTVLDAAHVDKTFPVGRSLGQVLRREPGAQVHAVDGMSLQAGKGRTLGIVGESGSGKTTVARCIVGLVARDSGEVTLLGLPLAPDLGDRDRAVLQRLQMVFQNPDDALNPYRTVGETLRRPLMHLAGASREEAGAGVVELLTAVRLSPDFTDRLPSQLSGGEKQRVAIARVFATRPDLVIFDESVSALDVSVQATILNLINDLQVERDSAYLFISHDLAVVGYLADDVIVMYLGQVLESGPAAAIFAPPYHPYTEALLSAIPLLDPDARQARIRLESDLPSPTNLPAGCRFHTRCPRFLGEICKTQDPPWQDAGADHRIRCHIAADELQRLQA